MPFSTHHAVHELHMCNAMQVTQQQGLQWMTDAVALLPESVLSASDRQKLLGVMQITAINGAEAENFK